jgi:flagellar protein FlbT
MALKLTLKPHERLILGGAVLTNGNNTSEILVENNVPILREKDIMRQEDANSPCRRIYFIIQLMYIDEKNLSAHHNTYWQLVRELLEAAPSTLGLIDQISWYILGNKYYQALKLTKKLIAYEQEAINHVRDTTERVPDKQ